MIGVGRPTNRYLASKPPTINFLLGNKAREPPLRQHHLHWPANLAAACLSDRCREAAILRAIGCNRRQWAEGADFLPSCHPIFSVPEDGGCRHGETRTQAARQPSTSTICCHTDQGTLLDRIDRPARQYDSRRLAGATAEVHPLAWERVSEVRPKAPPPSPPYTPNRKPEPASSLSTVPVGMRMTREIRVFPMQGPPINRNV